MLRAGAGMMKARSPGWLAAVGRRCRRCTRPIGSLQEIRTPQPHIVLTYDDGPEPGGTDAVLGTLADHGASATFFVLVSRARRHRSLLDQVVAAGHEIGLHGVDHRRLTTFSPAEVERRTRAGKAELEDMIGRGVAWFRPPYGAQTFSTWRAVVRSGLVPVLWGPELLDWRDITQDERVRAARRGARPGAIVLAHDGFAGVEDGVDDGPSPPVDRGELNCRVLDAYRDVGLVGRSLSDVLVEGKQVRWATFKR